MRNHETAVVGGFITETSADDKRGVPLLSSVPVLGALFGRGQAKLRTELVFLVTVNAEEPPALVPFDPDRSGFGRSAAPGPEHGERGD